MNINHDCLVCLGSNNEADFHLKNAQQVLQVLFQELQMGRVVTTKADGYIQQPDYLNQAASFKTSLSSQKVVELLKQIEKDNGRTPEDKLKGCVPLDIDLLKYDERVLKPGEMDKEYVRLALASLSH